MTVLEKDQKVTAKKDQEVTAIGTTAIGLRQFSRTAIGLRQFSRGVRK
jgi:hypothetical protein